MSTAVSIRETPAAEGNASLFGAAFQRCPESIAVVQRAAILYANPSFARLFHYLPAELDGVPLSALLKEGHRCVDQPGPKPSCGYPGCQFEGRCKDGQLVRMESTCAEFQWNGESFLVLTARDLRKERRRIVRDSEMRYRSIFDASAIAIVQCTLDGRVVETNRAAEIMLGYSHDELRGMHFRDFTHPEDLHADSLLFSEMVEGKRDSYQIELRFLRKDSRHGWNRLTVSLVRGPDGSPEFAIGMAEDITERKSAEAQLREAQKMEALGRLVGGVAHDFNNLLTAITLYGDLIGAGLPADSRLQRHVQEIRLAGEQGGALIQQLLAMVRQQPVEAQPIHLNEVIEEMRNLLTRLVGENIQVRTDLANDLPMVLADPTQMRQVVLNLVLNSRDAMPHGGEIRIETRLAQNTDPADSGKRPRLLMCVRDEGCGMDEETRSHLFEPFFTTKEAGRGNGLGLATVQRIVKQCGGTIQVESGEGAGTAVMVIFPSLQLDASRSQPAIEQARQQSLGGAETILLVEDDEQIRRSAQRVLRRCGYRVLSARNGGDAVRMSGARRGEIDLVITDLVLPGMSGREVVRRLREHRPGIKVIGASGFEQARSLLNTSDDKDFVFLPKPFTGESLVRKVREVLDAGCRQNREKKG